MGSLLNYIYCTDVFITVINGNVHYTIYQLDFQRIIPLKGTVIGQYVRPWSLDIMTTLCKHGGEWW